MHHAITIDRVDFEEVQIYRQQWLIDGLKSSRGDTEAVVGHLQLR